MIIISNKLCSLNNSHNPQKGSIDPFIAGIAAITLVILAIAVYFGLKMGGAEQVAADKNVTFTVDSNRHDWGTTDINGGIISKSFRIKNTGNSVLKLYNIKTSCMCTTAQLKTSSQTSGKFSMHEKDSGVFEVKQAETAELLVEFDPAFHGPSGIGPVGRTVTVSVNDAENSTLSFYLTADVVKK